MAKKKQKYRLQVLLDIKFRAKRQAEIVLAKAIKKLKEEEEKLKELELEKKKIEEKIHKERNAMFVKVSGGGAMAKDPQVHKNFIRKLEEDLEEQERKIEEQKEVIKQAQKALQRARQDYLIAAQELNIMEKHKELWEKKIRKELTALEDKEMNELGQTIHQIAKMQS